jgi:hypothetical protein
MKRLFLISAVGVFLLAISIELPVAHAQEMHDAATAKQSDHLEIQGMDGSKLDLTPADLKVLPHKTVTVFNAHIKKNETYSGVVLADLLEKVHAPLGEALKGKLFMTGIVAEGTDGYRVLYSLAEVDPAMHTGDVIVADAVNGEPIAKNGAFQLINTEDKRPARWVRNLDAIAVVKIQ